MDKNIISVNALLAQPKGIPTTFNLSCITLTTLSPMEEDQPYNEETVQHALWVKEVDSAPWMFKESMRCTVVQMGALLAWITINTVLIGLDKDIVTTTTLSG